MLIYTNSDQAAPCVGLIHCPGEGSWKLWTKTLNNWVYISIPLRMTQGQAETGLSRPFCQPTVSQLLSSENSTQSERIETGGIQQITQAVNYYFTCTAWIVSFAIIPYSLILNPPPSFLSLQFIAIQRNTHIQQTMVSPFAGYTNTGSRCSSGESL